MAEYKVRWITENLAAGYAPLSYADLEAIKEQSIDTIVNLCAEFCDFQEIERNTGFEVYYLPIADECSPDIEEMEKAFAWLDEAVMRGKKVLVHCETGVRSHIAPSFLKWHGFDNGSRFRTGFVDNWLAFGD